jgi:molybdenum cofactor guanylyltransferase
VLETLAAIFPEVIMIGKPRSGLDERGEIHPDLAPGLGPISGLYTALRRESRPVFLCAGDMPFLNADLIRYQVELLKGHDVVVPKPDGFYEPLHAVYAPSCLLPVERLIQARKKRPVGFFDQIRLREIRDRELDRFDPDRLSFFNINTKADLVRAEAILKAQSPRR